MLLYVSIKQKEVTTITIARRLQQTSLASLSSAGSLNLWHAPKPTDSLIATYPELIPLHNQPQAAWVGDWDTNPQQTVSDYASAAAGQIMILVIYAIPNRDSGGYSSGGFQDQASYLAWVTGVKDGAGSAPVWYVLEPDALGLADGLSAGDKAERLDTLAKAVTILKQGSQAKVYIDCSNWLASSDAANLLVSANIAGCEGYALNVSSFETTPDMYTFGDLVAAKLVSQGVTGKKYVIDTGRNGNGPLTSAFGSAADPWLNANKAWCNPPGRGLGLSPRIPAGKPNCDALLYIKSPGGSDGNDPGSTFFSNYYGENAPNAGVFWVTWAQDFMAHSDLSNLQ